MSNDMIRFLEQAAEADKDTWFNVHRRLTFQDGRQPIFPGNAHQQIQTAMEDANYWAQRGQCVYLAQGIFRSAGEMGRVYPKAIRQDPNLIACKNLYMDIDVKAEAYTSTKEALGGLKDFLSQSHLPVPNIIVGSGNGGLHVYWTLDTEFEPREFRRMAGQLIAAGDQHGLLFDRQCTRDAIRLLRIPGTWNFKGGPGTDGKPVTLMHLDREHIKLDVLRDALKLYKTTPHPRGVGDNSESKPGINDDLSGGMKYEYPPANIDEVAKFCPFIDETLKQGGANLIDEPQWHLVAGLSCHCDDPAATFERLSKGHPNYIPEHAEAKLATALQARKDRPSIGPEKCATIHNQYYIPQCAVCPHLALDTTPLSVQFKQPNNHAQTGSDGSASPASEEATPYDFWPGAGAPVLPDKLLPKSIEMFARGAAIVVGADEGGFALAALTVAAAAIDDAIKLQVTQHSTWLESARLWVAVVGEPSSKKSPILKTTCEPMEQEAHKLWDAHKIKMSLWKALDKPQRATTPEPICERLIIGDTTVEAAQHAFETTERGMLGVHDEMSGWFGSMERYGSNGRGSSDRAFMLQAYNGGFYQVDRIQRGSSYLKNIGLGILGGIQPDLIRKVMDAQNDDGLVQRLTPIMLRPGTVPNSNPQAANDAKSLAVLVPQLLRLKPSHGHLRFDDKAQAIQRELSIEHRGLVKGFERANRKLSTALGKQDGLFARLCVVWHAVEYIDGLTHEGKVAAEPAGRLVRRPGEESGGMALPTVVSESVAARVAEFMRQFLRPHLFDFYEQVLTLPEEYERLRAIAGYILSKNLKAFTNRQIQAAVRSARDLASKEITPVFEQLEAMGWLLRGATLRAGAPPVWNVNPQVHVVFNARATAETKRRQKVRDLIQQVASVKRHMAEED